MSKVFLIDAEKRPLDPIHPAQVRQLLRNKKAAIFRRFPFTIILNCSGTKFHFGFQTGDIVKAVVANGKKVGEYIGRIATRATGSFNISTTAGLVQGVSHKYCTAIHRKDGYSYAA